MGSSASLGTVMRDFNLPLTCTGISAVASMSRAGSYLGHGSFVMEGVEKAFLRRRAWASSAKWGAKGSRRHARR